MHARSLLNQTGKERWAVTPAVLPGWRPAGTAWDDGNGPDAEDGAEGFPERLYRWEGFSPPPDQSAEAYSLQWFLAIEHERHTRQARWLPGLLEFARHPGDTLLGLGNGLGTDWIQYARHGAKVIACSPVAAELALVRRNFELRGLQGRFLHAEPTSLPLADASIDVACLSGLLHEASNPVLVVAEVFRVLRPGGKVLAVVPSRYNLEYWGKFLWPWRRIGSMAAGKTPWRSAAPAQLAPRGFSRRRLARLFASFRVHRVYKRQLRRREMPWVWRSIPKPILERLLGRFLILKAFKPVGALSADWPQAA